MEMVVISCFSFRQNSVTIQIIVSVLHDCFEIMGSSHMFFIIIYLRFDILVICIYNSSSYLIKKWISKNAPPLYVFDSYVGCADVSITEFHDHQHCCL